MRKTTWDPLTHQIMTTNIIEMIQCFLIERQSRNLSHRTIQFYREELGYFIKHLDIYDIQAVGYITPKTIRLYLLALSERRNGGGCHAAYRAIRAFLNWFEQEYEPEGWKNPIKKVQPPQGQKHPLPGISLENIKKMLSACTTEMAHRDRAILLTLLDTGARASELVALNIHDLNIHTGAIIISNGKGNKRRVVYTGKKTLRAIRRYLRTRKELNAESPLFTTDEFERLTFSGLRQIIRRRAAGAGIDEPGLHDFRRAFALQCQRNGMDLLTVSRLLGHSSVVVTQRYICQDDSDLSQAHNHASPVDRM